MAKIKRIGDKKEILEKKKEVENQELCVNAIACKSEKQLDNWFKKHFAGLPAEAREGLKVMVKAIWADTKVKHKSGGSHSPK